MKTCRMCGDQEAFARDGICLLCREAKQQYNAAVAECALTGDPDKDAETIAAAVEAYEREVLGLKQGGAS